MDLALEVVRVLRRFKNAVLEGPPGTGKSHVVANVVEAWESETGRKLVGNGRGRYAITLHPSTTYEEFVEGLRFDDESASFVRKDGFLRGIINDAIEDPGSDYLVLIDELNRANIPKVFGDLLLTMESSKRAMWDGGAWTGGMEVTLPYSGSLFSVPSNVYLLGTMNSSDRSIAPLDSALRRRFGFIRVEPLVGDALRQAVAAVDGKEAAERLSRSIDQLTNLNEALRSCLGPNAMLGHSYLFGVTATEGSVADMNDPLADVRAEAAKPNVVSAMWLEARKLDGGSHTQLGLPDTDASGTKKGLIDSFFPMSSNGVETRSRSARGVHDKLEITFEGRSYVDNVVRWNQSGNNHRLYYQGETRDGSRFSEVGRSHRLDQKIHVWLRLDDHTFKLILLDNSGPVVAALQAVSVGPNGWHEQTRPSQHGPARPYGMIDLEALARAEPSRPNPDEDAEWMVWRYAILPQLVDTATQLGATDLLAKEARGAWLAASNLSHVGDRWAKFDDFLADLSLAIEEEGHGLARGLTVVDIPVGAVSQYLLPEVSNGPVDTDGSDDGD